MESRRCPRCGDVKPLSDFQLNRRTGYYKAYCKDCRRKYSIERYNLTKKARQGVYTDENGRKMNRQGCANSVYWDGNMISMMKRYFSDTPNLEMIELLRVNICQCTLIRKAKELGLKKSKEYLHNHSIDANMISNANRRKKLCQEQAVQLNG